MNKKIVLGTLGVGAAVLAIVLVVNIFMGLYDKKKCEEYQQLIGGTSYSAFDINQTKNHGKVTYDYKMRLNKDGTCEIDFQARRSGDKSTFAENGTFEICFTGLTWSVRSESGKYVVFISGEWDWTDWTAAELGRSMEIIDIENEDLFFKAIRSGYYDMRFIPINR